MSQKLGAIASLGCLLAACAPVFAGTTFLHHFDNPLGEGASTADFAVGNPDQLTPSPFGFGGQIVSSPAKFGNSLLRTNGVDIGGRIRYATAGNYNVNKGTIEMWINLPEVNTGSFDGLWGTDTGSGNTDVRMYIYDVGGVRTLGAYMLGGGGSFWEIEQAIPLDLLTPNEWHHVAWAYDMTPSTAANRKTATWWDGQLLRNTPDSGTLVPRTTFSNTRFQIGENQNGSAPFPGYIDEFRISDSIVYDTTQSFTPPTAPFTAPVPTWVLATGGIWDTPSAWSTGATPNGVGAGAELASTIATPQTILINSATTLGTLRFSSPVSFTLAGSASLVMDTSGANAVIDVSAGGHQIAVPLTLNKSTDVTTASGTTLTVSNVSVSASSQLNKLGSGTLNVNTISGGGALSLTAGKVALPAAVQTVSTLSDLTIANDGAALGSRTYNAALDVGHGDLIVRNGSLADLNDMARAGQNGATLFSGNGITSVVAAIDAANQLRYAVGVIQNNIDGSTLYDTFDGVSVGLTDVLVKFTYFGDADLNGFIDDTDFFLVNNGYGNGLTGWVNGDFDYSGSVDDTDFFLINNAYGLQGSPLRTGGSVPEPTALGMLVMAVGSLLARRRT